jgi:hypothetical protein
MSIQDQLIELETTIKPDLFQDTFEEWSRLPIEKSFRSALEYGIVSGIDYAKKIKIIEEDTEQLVSKCCHADFDSWGFVREDGLWDEKCLKCGEKCEIILAKKTNLK